MASAPLNLSSFLDTASTSTTTSGGQRPAPAPMAQQQQPVNGNGNGMNGVPMYAGQQMDVNLIYATVVELSNVLNENREKTQGIINGAEELATRAASEGANPSLEHANAEITVARVTELERQLAHAQNTARILREEQTENIKLIGDYEHHLGEVVKSIRDAAFNAQTEKTRIDTHWNALLQAEKDRHLETRFSLNEANAYVLELHGILGKAYRLRCEEEDVPLTVIAGLQNEVRAYRQAAGMEPQKPEEEFGYEFLKDMPNGGGEP